MKDKLEKYFDQLSYYMGNYHRFVTILLILVIFIVCYVVYGIKASLDKNTKAILESNKYAVMVNTQNQIRGFEKERLTDETYKFVIAGIIERYLVKSHADLSSRTGKKEFKDYKDFFSAQIGSGGLKEFYYNFIFNASKSKKTNFPELEKQGQASFLMFLRKQFLHFRNLDIPIVKDTQGTNLKDIRYTFNDDKFKISVLIYMKTSGVSLDGIAYQNVKQTAKFELEGYVDVDGTHPVFNPLGIRFNKITASPALNPKEINALRVKKKKRVRSQASKEASLTQEKRY